MQKFNAMRWKRLLLVTAMSLISVCGYAQSQVSGIIRNSSGEPMVGATVAVKGDKPASVITDKNGRYTIAVPEGVKTLSVSMMSMKPQTVAITGSEANVVLESDAQMIEEVVLIGYGTVKKRDLTGAVSSVGAKDINTIPVTTAAEAITGKLAGVQVTTTEGSPDAEIKIRVRGGGSITRDNSPLYIVDGFPLNNISDIPPTDIQSIDVLKDASSTAIYGARGANGVIIVTTKSAKEGKFTVSYNGYFGIKNIAKTLDVMDPYEFAFMQYENALLNNKVSDKYEPYFGSYSDIDLYKYMKGTDWQDVMFGRTGTTSNHSVSVTGGSSTASYNVSYSRIDDKAIMLGSQYARDNFNVKLNTKPYKWLKFDVSARYSVTVTEGAGANDVTGSEKSTNDSRVKNSVIYTPLPIRNTTVAGDDEESFGGLYSPVIQNADNDRYKKRNALNINGGVSVNFTKNLLLRTELGIDDIFNEDNRFYGSSTYYVNGGGLLPVGFPGAQLVDARSSSFRNTNTLTYTKTFCKNHNFSAMVGEELISSEAQSCTSIMQGFPKFFDSKMAWAFSSQGDAVSVSNYYYPDDRLVSFFGRVNYDFKGKYLISGTFRADGSSKFAPGNQWGYFPSVSAAWRISDEKFMQGSQGWLNTLKLRASYGTAGNNNIPGLAYMQVYSSSATNFLPFASSFWTVKPEDGKTLMSNENLKWETTVTRNMGLDFGFFRNRLTGTFDIYKNNTKDLLINYPTPGSGYSTQLRNVGETSNKGFEFSINAILVESRDFHMDFNFNFSANRNKVESLGGLEQLDRFTSGWTKSAFGANEYLVQVGRPLGEIYGYVSDGYYSVDDFNWDGAKWVVANADVVDNSVLTGKSWGPGAMKLKDIDGNKKITNDNADRVLIGNALPKHTGGFGLNASYKGFDMSAAFNWVYGNSILNANKIEFTATGAYYYRNMLNSFSSGKRFSHVDKATGERVTDKDALRAMNANASLWSPVIDGGTGLYPLTSWAVEDGSFLRLNNLTVGYTFPKRWMNKVYIQSLRVYVSAHNLYTWTSYTGYDPEVDSRRATPLTPGVDYSAYPKSRSFNFGVNLTF